MKIIIAIVLLLGVVVSCSEAFERPFSDYEFLFSAWKEMHNKGYSSTEEHNYRIAVFAQNLDFIEAHNKEPSNTYTVAMNEFGDLTLEEFKAAKLGYRNQYWRTFRRFNEVGYEGEQLPDSVDWRKKNAVTGIKNQGQCGSCWAFSTTGSLEGLVAIQTGKLVPLSEQELVDCSGAEGNQGCNGGLMDQAFKFIIKNHGLCSEADYGYQGTDGQCKKSSCQNVPGTDITGFHDVTANNEQALQKAAARQPVSVAIEADQAGFQFYNGGVFTGACGTNLDHGVLVVGYGTDNGQAYWIVKNSWGSSWGESGYIRLARNVSQKQGQCGVAMQPSYPVKN